MGREAASHGRLSDYSRRRTVGRNMGVQHSSDDAILESELVCASVRLVPEDMSLGQWGVGAPVTSVQNLASNPCANGI